MLALRRVFTHECVIWPVQDACAPVSRARSFASASVFCDQGHCGTNSVYPEGWDTETYVECRDPASHFLPKPFDRERRCLFSTRVPNPFISHESLPRFLFLLGVLVGECGQESESVCVCVHIAIINSMIAVARNFCTLRKPQQPGRGAWTAQPMPVAHCGTFRHASR